MRALWWMKRAWWHRLVREELRGREGERGEREIKNLQGHKIWERVAKGSASKNNIEESDCRSKNKRQDRERGWEEASLGRGTKEERGVLQVCQGIKRAYAGAYDPENWLLRSLLIGPINLYHSDPRGPDLWSAGSHTRPKLTDLGNKKKRNLLQWSSTPVGGTVATATPWWMQYGCPTYIYCDVCNFFWLAFSIGGLKVSFVLKVLRKIHWLLFIREDIL